MVDVYRHHHCLIYMACSPAKSQVWMILLHVYCTVSSVGDDGGLVKTQERRILSISRR